MHTQDSSHWQVLTRLGGWYGAQIGFSAYPEAPTRDDIRRAVKRATASVPEVLYPYDGKDRWGDAIVAFEAEVEATVIDPDGYESNPYREVALVGWETLQAHEERARRGEGKVVARVDHGLDGCSEPRQIWVWKRKHVRTRPR
jgi:hypothetical protein